MANAPTTPLTASQLLGSLKATGTTTSYAGSDLTDNDNVQAALGSSATRSGNLASALTGAGGETLGPVLEILSKLLGGNRQSVMEGAGPDVARVSDQYDAARKTIMQNSPRGGGRAMAINEMRTKEAGDITNLLNQQRSEARKEAGTIGTELIGKGITANSNETTALTDLLGNLTSQRGQTMQFWSSLIQSISSMVASIGGGGK
jgi:hypothetical protein